MPSTVGSNGYTSGSNYNGVSNTGGTGAVASSSNSGGSSGCDDQLNPACGYWVMDYSRCVDDAVSSNCPLIWIKY